MNFFKNRIKKMDFLTEEEEGCKGIVHVYRNLLCMLKDRGYDVNEEYNNIENMSNEEFLNGIDWTDLNKVYTHPNHPTKLQTIWIRSTNDKIIKIDQVTTELSALNIKMQNITTDLLFISKEPIGTQASEKIESFNINRRNEFFTYNRLLIRIPEHYLVHSKIEPLSVEETNLLMYRLQIKPSNFKIISTQDMLVRWFALKPGEVIRITSENEHLGRQVDYKMVTPISSTNTPLKSNALFN